MSARAATTIYDIPSSAKTRTIKKSTRISRQIKVRPAAKLAKVSKTKVTEEAPPRTSQVLLDILTKNKTEESFTVEKLLDSIGTTSFGTSLMFFAIPEVLPIPIPGMAAVVVLPTGVLSAQMVAGRSKVSLPNYLLQRRIPRKAIAAAIHAILPFLRKAEKVTKPRWHWASSPTAQRLLGAFIFLLAASIAFPMPGFNMPQAISIFIIGLGLVEKDGLMICTGVIIGLLGMLLLGAVLLGLSALAGF